MIEFILDVNEYTLGMRLNMLCTVVQSMMLYRCAVVQMGVIVNIMYTTCGGGGGLFCQKEDNGQLTFVVKKLTTFFRSAPNLGTFLLILLSLQMSAFGF